LGTVSGGRPSPRSGYGVPFMRSGLVTWGAGGGQERMGQQSQGSVPVPAWPFADLVVIQANLGHEGAAFLVQLSGHPAAQNAIALSLAGFSVVGVVGVSAGLAPTATGLSSLPDIDNAAGELLGLRHEGPGLSPWPCPRFYMFGREVKRPRPGRGR
jgi:hypothetical protein